MGLTASKPDDARPVVLVLGGGLSGVLLARALDADFHVVILERKNYFLFPFTTLRASTEPSLAPSIIIPYSRLLDNGLVVTHAHVTDITPEGVKVAGCDRLFKFDYLVIATGCSFAFPLRVAAPNAPDALKMYSAVEQRLLKSSHILIVGGGAAGVELLGEISDRVPEAKITLIHSRDHLIPMDLTQSYKDEVLRQVRALPNVEVILQDRVIIDEEDLKSAGNLVYIEPRKPVTTEKGRTLEPDLVFFCGGGKANTASLAKSVVDKLDESGRVKVNSFLQVEGMEKVFAVGDCANVNETKRGASARKQGAWVAKNIRAHHAGQPLQEYRPKRAGLILTIGRRGGAVQPPLGLDIVGGALPVSLMKRRDLGATTSWRRLGVSKPSEFIPESYSEEVPEEKLEQWEKILGIPKEELVAIMKSEPAMDLTTGGRC